MRINVRRVRTVDAQQFTGSGRLMVIQHRESARRILGVLLGFLLLSASPVWAQASLNLTCQDVPLKKIVRAGWSGSDNPPELAYYAGGYAGAVGSPGGPPVGSVPSNYLHYTSILWCPYGNSSYHIGVYRSPGPTMTPGNNANYPGTQIPVNTLTEQSCAVGNPCSVGSGLKTQIETDFVSAGSSPLALKRIYRSSTLVMPMDGFGSVWMHEWQRRLDLSHYNNATPRLSALRGDGTTTAFTLSNGVWTATDGKGDQVASVSDAGGAGQGFRLIDRRTDSTEDYDADGKLLLVKTRNGWTTSLKYSTTSTPTAVAPYANLLIEIRSQFGQTIGLAYDAFGRITAATLPDATTVQYSYNNYGMLSTVTYADGSQRKHHYESPEYKFRWALIGITDEKGIRFATYGYDSLGRATSTEHAGGVDKYQLSFLGNGQTSVTTADGTSRIFTSELQGNVLRTTGASASCAACGDIAKAVTYDATGNVASKKDFTDAETRYTYDAQGRETQRIEGYGTGDAKTTTTEWHPTWTLPLRVAAPSRVDYFTYDGMGQMTAHGWFPTADSNGSQGLSAAPSGAASSNSYGYDANGLMTALTEQVDGAVNQQWTFGYDAQGNLTSAADGTGRSSRAVQYDPAGRLLEAVDLEGTTVKYVYDQRGRVLQYLYGDNVTAYVYDAIGQKVQVTSPNGDVTNYTYDAAHRLIDVLYNGQSLTGPDPDEQLLALANTTRENAGANPFGAWMGWISRLFNWLFGSAHAQATPASAVALGASVSIPGTYTPNPWDVLAPDVGGKKPWEWLAIWTTRLIESCTGPSKNQVHRGRIQAQGPGYRDVGKGDVERWGLSLSPQRCWMVMPCWRPLRVE